MGGGGDFFGRFRLRAVCRHATKGRGTGVGQSFERCSGAGWSARSRGSAAVRRMSITCGWTYANTCTRTHTSARPFACPLARVSVRTLRACATARALVCVCVRVPGLHMSIHKCVRVLVIARCAIVRWCACARPCVCVRISA
jgi:hypothetical protein